MNCEICNQPFNLTNKVPLMLHCCGGTTCKECVINIAGGPQQRLFTCPFKDCSEQNQDQNTLKPNKHLEKVLKSAIGILCDQHPQIHGEFYCSDDQQFVCAACIVGKHNGHQFQSVDKQDIINYNNKILDFLKKEQEIINRLVADIEQYQTNEKQLLSVRYMELIKEAYKIVNPTLNLQEINSIKFPPFKQIEREELKVPQQPFKQIEKKQQLDVDSKLIKQKDFNLLQKFLGTDKLSLELIYRGSDNGFGNRNFHQHCDGKGPTITVMKSEFKQVFGGFTSISWGSNEFVKEDSKAFLFQLSKKFKLTQSQNKYSAVRHSSQNGPSFGGGCDLMIGLNSNYNENKSCYSNIHSEFNRTYNLPADIQNNREEAAKYIAGAQYFKLKEIEVFKAKTL